MKEYKLSAWPDLPQTYHRASFRRMLHDLDQRHATVEQLMASSGAGRLEVRLFLQMLAERGLLAERDAQGNGLAALGGWLRRTLHVNEFGAHR